MKNVRFFAAAGFILAVFIGVSPALAAGPNYSAFLNKGTWNFGGMISYMSYGGDLYGSSGMSTFSFTPAVKYFITPNLAIGGQVALVTNSEGSDSTTAFGIGPSAAYFFNVKSERFFPYIGAGFLYMSNSSSWSSNSATGTDIYFGGGMAFMLSSSLALIAELTYHIQSLSMSGTSESGHMLALSIGFSAFLHK